MKKILAFGASNSQQSINKQLARYAANQLENVDLTFIDLNDFEMPLYGIDKEKAHGIPDLAHQFADLIGSHDGILISLAEHNSNYTVAFKNITDWVSRLENPVWQNRKICLLSTSPGGRGGGNVMEIALQGMPHRGAQILSHFSLPFFYKNFSAEAGILDPELKVQLEQALEIFKESVVGSL